MSVSMESGVPTLPRGRPWKREEWNREAWEVNGKRWTETEKEKGGKRWTEERDGERKVEKGGERWRNGERDTKSRVNNTLAYDKHTSGGVSSGGGCPRACHPVTESMLSLILETISITMRCLVMEGVAAHSPQSRPCDEINTSTTYLRVKSHLRLYDRICIQLVLCTIYDR